MPETSLNLSSVLDEPAVTSDESEEGDEEEEEEKKSKDKEEKKKAKDKEEAEKQHFVRGLKYTLWKKTKGVTGSVKRRKGGHFTIWYMNNKGKPVNKPDTNRSRKSLAGIKPSTIEYAIERPGVFVPIDGRRRRPSSTTEALEVLPGRRSATGFCAVNALSLASPLPDSLYESIKDKGPDLSLKQAVHMITSSFNRPFQLEKTKGVDDTKLLAWLLLQTTGKYVISFDCHCVFWDADNQLITDPDPIFAPNPLPINEASLGFLKITAVSTCYKVVSNFQRKG